MFNAFSLGYKLLCESDPSSSYFIISVKLVQHDNGIWVVVIQHSPEVSHSVGKGHLCHYEPILLGVALKHKRTIINILCKDSETEAHTHSYTYSHMHMSARTHTHLTYTHIHTLTHSHTHTLSLSLSLSHTHVHTHHPHTHTHTHPSSHTHTHTLSLSNVRDIPTWKLLTERKTALM